MKKVLVIFMVSWFAALSGFTQFQAGVKAGADIQKIAGQSYSEQFAFGYHVGAYAQIPFEKKMGIQPEVYYSEVNLRKANTISPVYSNLNLDSIKNIDLGYINVPILFYYKATKHLTLQAGPKFGILSSTNLSTVGGEIKDALKKGDLSMVAGFQLNYSGIRIYGRYQIGLSDINDVAVKEKWTSQAIHIGVGLRLF